MENERFLLVELKRGERRAFDAIFKRYSPKLYFFSFTFFNDKADAEEIVQETFVKVWENRHKIDPEKHFNTYLVTIAKRIIYNHFRHKVVAQKYTEHIIRSGGDSYSMEEEIFIKSLQTILLAGMERLPPQQREIITLKHKGYENDEIAWRLQLSKRTVETHINKAFKFLRKYLAEQKGAFTF